MEPDHRLKLSRALRRILLPLVRLCIRNEVSYADFAELSRMSFVESAREDFQLPGAEMSNARISVLTGMSRKHIKLVLEKIDGNDVFSPTPENRAQRVVQGWLNDSEFLDSENRPMALTIKGPDKEPGSFIELIKRYGGDVSYGAILDQLNHLKLTRHFDENTVELIDRGYIPLDNILEQTDVIGKSVSDLFKTALYNVHSDVGARRLQRQVVYSHIDAERAKECQSLIEESSKELIDKLNVKLNEVQIESSDQAEANLIRVGFGVYYIEEAMDSQPITEKKSHE